MFSDKKVAEETGSNLDSMSRRDFVSLAAVAAAGAETLRGGDAVAQIPSASPIPRNATPSGRGGLLYPQQNQFRNLLDLSGLWEFQMDPQEEGEAQGWFKALPAPRQIPVPCSWNDLFDDARDHLGLAWYLHEVYVPAGWRGQRMFLRIGSANYAAKVWVNGSVVAEHLGGHLPFVAEVSSQLVWDRKNVIAISVENKQLVERFADFKTGQGTSRAGGINHKGVFTRDRRPKMAAHFLRERWTKQK
jgi:beta-glucuronidase